MNIKDIVIPLTFAVAITLAMQYFFGPKVQEVTKQSAGQRIEMQQQMQDLAKPLNIEVEFASQQAQSEHVSEVVTSYAHLEFSSLGGCLKNVTYHRTVDGKSIDLTTMVPTADYEKAQGCFLVALDKETPYYYILREHKDDNEKATLTYEADGQTAHIAKTFTVYKNSYQIDMGIIITPNQEVQARVLFPAPLLQGSTKAEHIAAIIEEQDQNVVKYQLSRARRKLQDSLWAFPTLIGAEDRYFAHVLFKDQHHFVQRGYYQVLPDRIITVVEGPVMKKGTGIAWDMSFYMGPKEHAALASADQRLEVLLDYGWLSFLCKPMLAFMNWINEYVHNFGLAIILFTLLIRLLLIPLTWPHTKNAKKMREMQNKLKYINQRYKDDPEVLERERTELYKKYGLSGLSGLGGGCLPLLLQMPIFFAMNRVLTSSIELYQAPFLWIPDLSSKDPLYILPILVAVSMFLNTASLAANEDTQSKVSGFIMAIVFGAFSIGFSAGLSLYIFASTFVGAAQIYIQKKFKML